MLPPQLPEPPMLPGRSGCWKKYSSSASSFSSSSDRHQRRHRHRRCRRRRLTIVLKKLKRHFVLKLLSGCQPLTKCRAENKQTFSRWWGCCWCGCCCSWGCYCWVCYCWGCYCWGCYCWGCCSWCCCCVVNGRRVVSSTSIGEVTIMVCLTLST